MTSHSGHACSGRHDLAETAGQELVDRLVGSGAPVELDEDRGGHSNRDVPVVRDAQSSSHAAVAVLIDSWASQGRDGFAVED